MRLGAVAAIGDGFIFVPVAVAQVLDRPKQDGGGPIHRRINHSLVFVRMVAGVGGRSEEHTSELQSLMRLSYAVFCLTKKTHKREHSNIPNKPTHINNA